VNPEFWQKFVPAMLARAKANGIPNFHIFGEVYDPDPGMLARFTRVDGYPAVLDFAFQAVVTGAVAGNAPTASIKSLFDRDVLYVDGTAGARQLPTFLGNHDMGRIGHFISKANPTADEAELLARTQLAHSMLLLLRGVPTLYYGDEQGMTGDGGDQDAREPMFPSAVKSYNDNNRLGTDATPATAAFNPSAPLYAHVRALAALRTASPALRRGDQTILGWQETPGLLALSRQQGEETILVAFNTSGKPLDARVAVSPLITGVEPLMGSCAAPDAPGSWRVQLPAFGTLVCRAR
jgi:glycosidase